MPGAKLRVLYDATLTANPAGTGTFARGVLAGLQRQPELEVLTTTLSSPGVGVLDTRRKRRISRLRQSLRHLSYYLLTLPARARELRADAVFSPSALVPLRGSTPLTMTVFDLTIRRYPETQDALSRRYAEFMLSRGLRRARSVCTISRAVAGELADLYGARLPPVHVAYPGPNPDLITATPQPPFTGGAPFVLMVGTLEPRKNHVTALRAFARYRERHGSSDLRLILAGAPGWRYDEVLRLIEQLGLGQNVVRLGGISAGQLSWLYRHATGLLFPSLYEGFGLPVLEAFLLRCPVVAADIPVVREVAESGTALLLPPLDVDGWADAIDQLATQPADAAMLDRAVTRGRFFTWDRCVESVVAALFAAADRRLSSSTRGEHR